MLCPILIVERVLSLLFGSLPIVFPGEVDIAKFSSSAVNPDVLNRAACHKRCKEYETTTESELVSVML